MSERYYDDKLQAWVTKCPPGAALGAGDLRAWATRRAGGLGGSDGLEKLKQAKQWKMTGTYKRRRRARRMK